MIIDRPKKIQGDFVSMNDIIAYDLSKIDSEHFLQTHSTNPLLRSQTIDLAIETYFQNPQEFDSLFSVTRLQTRLYWKDDSPINHNPNELLRTQDLPPMYEENSNFYLFSKEYFDAAERNRIDRKPKIFVMNKPEAVDIDEEDDFVLAEMVFRIRTEKGT